MKFTKRLLTIALSMSMVMPLCATAYAEKTVDILSAKVKPNATDSSLYDVTVRFTVKDSNQVTLLLTGPNANNDGPKVENLNDNDIVHINQFGRSELTISNGTVEQEFSVSKARMGKETGVTVDEATGAIDRLWVSMGANDADEAASKPVTYEASDPAEIPATAIKLKSETTLTVGKTETLTAELTPSNATSTIAWVSSNTAVATVDTTGTVKAVAEGNATITAFIDTNGDGVLDEDETIRDTCEVTVTAASSILYGDVNGDTRVNGLDITDLARYLAEWEGYETINLSASDVNGDTRVNGLDITDLARYLAEWEGYETLPIKQ